MIWVGWQAAVLNAIPNGSKLFGAAAFHNVLQYLNLAVRERANDQFGSYSPLRGNDRKWGIRAVLFGRAILHTAMTLPEVSRKRLVTASADGSQSLRELSGRHPVERAASGASNYLSLGHILNRRPFKPASGSPGLRNTKPNSLRVPVSGSEDDESCGSVWWRAGSVTSRSSRRVRK
jgi:hypothetical protein